MFSVSCVHYLVYLKCNTDSIMCTNTQISFITFPLVKAYFLVTFFSYYPLVVKCVVEIKLEYLSHLLLFSFLNNPQIHFYCLNTIYDPAIMKFYCFTLIEISAVILEMTNVPFNDHNLNYISIHVLNIIKYVTHMFSLKVLILFIRGH